MKIIKLPAEEPKISPIRKGEQKERDRRQEGKAYARAWGLMHKTFVTLAVIDGVASVAILGGWLVAQIAPHVVPEVSNGWQLAAFLGLLGLNAYGMWVQREASRTIQSKVDNVGDKTEVVHKALNSQLDTYKREAADAARLATEDAVKRVRLEMEKLSNDRLAGLERKIATLEAKLDNAREMAVALAVTQPAQPLPAPSKVTIVNPEPLPVTETPVKHQNEIRGE